MKTKDEYAADEHHQILSILKQQPSAARRQAQRFLQKYPDYPRREELEKLVGAASSPSDRRRPKLKAPKQKAPKKKKTAKKATKK